MFPVRELYLEDILLNMDYSTTDMDKLKASRGVDGGVGSQSRAEALIHLTQGLNINKSELEKNQVRGEKTSSAGGQYTKV